ncbi:MAG TPA: AzlD domain-containing protein [Thermomicrobiales bacterium]|nr:AzlD domain-containing protein [Thermomicrobiales bacterium]
MDRQLLVTMLGMVTILYVTRISGYMLVGRMPASPALDRVLNQLPGVTLVALVAPAVAQEALPGFSPLWSSGWLLFARTTSCCR